MTTLTLAEVAAIKDTAQKATPGSWFVDEDDRPNMEWNRHIMSSPGHAVCFMAHSGGRNPDRDEATAAHIANLSPERVIALCEAWEALRELVDADKMRIAARAAGTHDGERDNLMRKANHTENAAVARARALFADKEG